MSRVKSASCDNCKTDDQKSQNPTTETVNDYKAIIESFSELYNSKRFSDIVLRVEDDRYYAHKFVLVVASNVFEAMLGQPTWIEGRQAEVLLTEQDECVPVFGQFLRYLYTGVVDLTTDTVLPTLLLADKYAIKTLQESCITYMLRHIVESPDTNRALTWYQYGKMCSKQDLQESCVKFILSNFTIVLNASDWLHMTLEEMEEFLASSELVVESELTLWQKVDQWLAHPMRDDDVKENLERILPLMRFTMLTPTQLVQVEKSEIVRDNRNIFDAKLNHAYRHHSLIFDQGADQADKEPFRNFISKNYSICCNLYMENYPTIKKIDSKVAIDCIVPLIFTPARTNQNSPPNYNVHFLLEFFPKGHFITYTLYGSYMGRQTEHTMLKITRCRRQAQPMKVDFTFVLFSMKNDVKYISYAYPFSHQFQPDSNECLIKSVIELDILNASLIDGKLDAKLFMKAQEVVFVEGEASNTSS